MRRVRLIVMAALVGILAAACTSPTLPPYPDPTPPETPAPDPSTGLRSPTG